MLVFNLSTNKMSKGPRKYLLLNEKDNLLLISTYVYAVDTISTQLEHPIF